MAIVRHNELRDLLGVYSLGMTDAQEAEALRAHLATCAECQAELRDLREAVAALPLIAEPMDPSPALRSRIEAAILAESSPVPAPTAPRLAPVPPPPVIVTPASFWASARPWAAIAAALLLLTVGMLIWNLRLQNQLASTPVAETIALAPTDAAPGASGEVRYDPAARLFLLAVRDLPPLAPDQVYQVWLIGPDGVPRPEGVFDQSTDQFAVIADRRRYDTLAITTEPGPLGVTAPTGEILATASL